MPTTSEFALRELMGMSELASAQLKLALQEGQSDYAIPHILSSQGAYIDFLSDLKQYGWEQHADGIESNLTPFAMHATLGSVATDYLERGYRQSSPMARDLLPHVETLTDTITKPDPAKHPTRLYADLSNLAHRFAESGQFDAIVAGINLARDQERAAYVKLALATPIIN